MSFVLKFSNIIYLAHLHAYLPLPHCIIQSKPSAAMPELEHRAHISFCLNQFGVGYRHYTPFLHHIRISTTIFGLDFVAEAFHFFKFREDKNFRGKKVEEEEEEVKTRIARPGRKTLCIFTILRTRIHLNKSRLSE